MPILSESPSLHPASLLEIASLTDADGWDNRRWWTIYTKARQEKAIARDLWQQEIPFYLPLIRRPAVYHRHHVTVTTPLFAGYVFVRASDEERVATLATGRVSRVLAVNDPEQFQRDLQQIQRLIASGAPLTVESRLAPGHRVRVRRGPLAGLEGTVAVRRGQTRLLVQVNFLQKGASVEIHDFLLEPIG